MRRPRTDEEEVYYEKPDISGGLEVEDYYIFIGAEDEDIDEEA
jgi:hypothetical protein